MMYFLVPAIIFIYGDSYNKRNDLLGNLAYNSTTETRVRIYFIVLISYILLLFPAFFNKKRLFVERYDYSLDTDAVKKYAKKFYAFTLILGSIGFLGMMAKIGLSGFINYSGSSRDTNVDSLELGGLFSYFNILSKYMIAALAPGIILYELYKTNQIKIQLIVILVCSILIELYNAGKSNFIMFLIPLLIYYSYRKGNLNTSKILIFGVVIVLLVPLLDNLFYYISRGESIEKYRTNWGITEYINSVSRQFVYPYANLVSSQAMNEYYGYRWFADYAAFINLIPAKLLGGFQVQTLYHLTTDYYGEQFGFTAGVPNDFVFLAYRQLDIIGVIILSIIRGLIIHYIDSKIKIVKSAFSKNSINSTHLITCCCLISVLITLIEPLSAFYSQPIIFLSVIFGLTIKNKCITVSVNADY